jgi:hypothetical protein
LCFLSVAIVTGGSARVLNGVPSSRNAAIPMAD